MDLPAARQASQLAGHRADIFCTCCDCWAAGKRARARTDWWNWKRRDPLVMRQQAELWRMAKSSKEREKIFNTYGVRYSELWRLPYWDPTRQLSPEPVHNMLEGNVPFHFRTLLGLTTTEAERKTESAPAFEFSFEQVNEDVNSQLPDKERLSANALKDVRAIHARLTQSLEGDKLESSLASLRESLSKRNMGALAFVGRSLGLTDDATRKTKAPWVEGLLGWVRCSSAPSAIRSSTYHFPCLSDNLSHSQGMILLQQKYPRQWLWSASSR